MGVGQAGRWEMKRGTIEFDHDAPPRPSARAETGAVLRLKLDPSPFHSLIVLDNNNELYAPGIGEIQYDKLVSTLKSHLNVPDSDKGTFGGWENDVFFKVAKIGEDVFDTNLKKW